MSIVPIGSAAASQVWPASAATEAGPTSATAPTTPLGEASSAGGGGDSFASMLGNALDSVQSTQAAADNMATQAATGSLTNVTDYMVAAEEANIQTQLTSAVRNNALQAFQQIMGMQL